MSRKKAPPRPPVPTEAEVTAQVLEAAAMLGLKMERRNVGGMVNPKGQYVTFGEEGDPDWECTLPGGRRCRIEIKRAGKRPTPEQLAKLREVNAMGGVGLWTDDAARFLRLMPIVIAGGRVEIDERGIPWVTDEEGR
jgi:hypothetical protein